MYLFISGSHRLVHYSLQIKLLLLFHWLCMIAVSFRLVPTGLRDKKQWNEEKQERWEEKEKGRERVRKNEKQ